MSSLLRDLEGREWGWVLYRTTYTAESNETFPKAIEKLDSYTSSAVRLNTQRESARLGRDLHQELMAQYKPVVIEDPSLDQASFDHLRVHFKGWLASQNGQVLEGYPRWTMFLIMDEESLKTITAAPAQKKYSDPSYQAAFIRAVDQEPDSHMPGPSYRGQARDPPNGQPFPGWMKVKLSYLHDLWLNLCDYKMSRICPSYIPGTTFPFYGTVE